MEVLPIKTSVMNPPKDELFVVFDEYLNDVREGDIVAVSSKIVAIGEGNCVPVEGTDKQALVAEESELSIPRDYWGSPLTVKANAFIGTAGVDESNSDGYFVKLPKDPFESAKRIHDYLKKRFGLKELGVIITDSHSSPLRRGATGTSIGFWGFEPVIDCVGKEDLFGREMKLEVVNLVDGLAASASVVMGEVAECQPVVMLRNVPDVTFKEGNLKDMAYVSFKEDTYRVLYERWLK